MTIITKIVYAMKEIYAVSAENEENIEALDNEVDDIGGSTDSIIQTAERHLAERLAAGEMESIISLQWPQSSVQLSAKSDKILDVQQKQDDAKEASKRLENMEEEQSKLVAKLQLAKQRTEDARKVANLNKLRAEEAERALAEDSNTVDNFLERPEATKAPPNKVSDTVATHRPINLKGVEIPTFTGVDKTNYEPWKAAFMAAVDSQQIPVGEKMIRLQNSLSGKALTMVRDLGYSRLPMNMPS